MAYSHEKAGDKTNGARLPALLLYKGKVMHARMKPVQHRFSYSMSSILIDIDRLDEADRCSLLFSVNRANLISFNEKDFGARDGTSLRAHVNSLLTEAGMEAPHRVNLLCYPKVLGNGFNPLAVYFCYNRQNDICALIYEVRNTFGETHTYVEPIRPGQVSKAGIRQSAAKLFYVSPFLDMEMNYHFRIKEPGDNVAVRILETDPEGPILSATFFGERRLASGGSLFKTLLQTAGLTWKVVAGIHYEALRLWIKGLRIRPRNPHQISHSYPGAQKKQVENKA